MSSNIVVFVSDAMMHCIVESLMRCPKTKMKNNKVKRKIKTK